MLLDKFQWYSMMLFAVSIPFSFLSGFLREFDDIKTRIRSTRENLFYLATYLSFLGGLSGTRHSRAPALLGVRVGLPVRQR
jgi:hypothetical protein